jgi:hypothetical protein
VLLPRDQVDHVIPLVPAVCRQCGELLPTVPGPGDPADERQQVTELPSSRAEVTEYQLAARRCRGCGTVTRASRPATVGAGSFGPRLQALVALLIHSLRSGLRYRLSRREVVQLLGEVWGAPVALGSVSELEQATSTALAPVVAEAQAVAQCQFMADTAPGVCGQGAPAH